MVDGESVVEVPSSNACQSFLLPLIFLAQFTTSTVCFSVVEKISSVVGGAVDDVSVSLNS